MDTAFRATHLALDHYDAVDAPALALMHRKSAIAANIAAFNEARKHAADKVRAAFAKDTGDVIAQENIELMSVEKIRDATERTLLGRLLALLP
jgi:hypothetical protein